MSLDLHIHSTHSDGTLSPSEIISLASRKGLKGISITDHDSVSSFAEINECTQEFDINVMSGVELSIHFNGVNVHLLGYGFDYTNSDLTEYLFQIQNGRVARNIAILDRLSNYGVKVASSEKELFENKRNFGRPHIAKILVNKGIVPNMRTAFSEYLGINGKAFVERPLFHLDEAIEILHGAGGVALIAHPFNTYIGDLSVDQFLTSLLSTKLDGLEAYYPTHSKKMERSLLEFCTINDLVCSGGSDYHGDLRPGTYLAGGKNVSVPENVWENLINRQLRYI